MCFFALLARLRRASREPDFGSTAYYAARPAPAGEKKLPQSAFLCSSFYIFCVYFSSACALKYLTAPITLKIRATRRMTAVKMA